VTDRVGIATFVRETLGCSCPEEVFRTIDVEDCVELTSGLMLDMKIDVGRRLLIYIVEVDDVDFIEKSLTMLIRHGKSERDGMKFNRFRLVVATDREEVRKIGLTRFHECEEKDERVHLHIIESQSFRRLR
jgi:hypothetical protein